KASGINATDEKDTWDEKKRLVERTMDGANGKLSPFNRFRNRLLRFLSRLFPYSGLIVVLYVIIISGIAFLLLGNIGRDVLPKVNAGQFQVRLRAPEGTRVEATELDVVKTLAVLDTLVGKNNIAITSAFVGQHPGLFSTSPIYLFMAGQQEAVLQVQLKENYKTNLEDLQDRFRQKMKEALPDVKLSFEPIQLTDKILSQGSPTPIYVNITGKNKKLNEVYANKLIEKFNQIPYLRDVQIGQSTHYPTIDIDIDRIKAATLGLDVADISKTLSTSTASSRYTDKNVWL